MSSVFSLLHFTAKILFPKYPYSILQFLSTVYLAIRYSKKRKMFKVQSVPREMFSILLQENKSQDFETIDSCMLVSVNSLKSLGVSNYSWLKIVRRFNKSTGFDNNTFLICMIAVPHLDDTLAVVTNILHHNISMSSLLVNDMVILEKTDFSDYFVPQFGTLIKVSFLQTFETDREYFDTILSNHFQHTRYLRKGDVFCIDVENCGQLFYLQNTKVHNLYFKVVDIQGPEYKDVFCFGYYIQKAVSSLVQCENQQGFLPCNDIIPIKSTRNINGSNFNLFLLNNIPPSLEVYRDELLTCVQPFVKAMDSSETKPIFMLSGPCGVGKEDVIRNISEMLGVNLWSCDSLEMQGGPPGYAEGRLKFISTKVQHLSPCILVLKNAEMLCKDKDGKEDVRAVNAFSEEMHVLLKEVKSFPVIIVALCNSKDGNTSMVPALARMFLHVINLKNPEDFQRAAMLQWILKKEGIETKTDLSYVASRTSGYLYRDLVALLSHTLRNFYKRISNSYFDEEVGKDKMLTDVDFEAALDALQAAYADAIDAPKIPKVSWDDVGGLLDLKEEITRTIMMPLQHPELLAAGLRRSGILLYGPPGTGKTLLAKAIATECNLNFLSVKGPELLNMYVGQSEENVREVFDRAQAASPCIIFFDELDSLAPNRGRSGDSGGVMDRVVSQLLAEMDGLKKSTHLFVIGATNRPDLIDPALLRPGRFEKLLYVGVSEDKNSQLSILKALTRRFQLKNDLKLKDIVHLLPNRLTGADLYSLCSLSWLNAVKTYIATLPNNLSSNVEVGIEDFKQSINCFMPSVSDDDLSYFQKIKEKM